MTKVAGTGSAEYDKFVQEMHEAGLKTTRINKGEADFADYGNALDEELQQRILDSFDCEQDYIMQQELAAFFADRNTNYMQSKDFIAACKQLGYTVNVKYEETDYISDWKAGNFDNSVTQNGHIAVYTISDGNGGEIVIADANGNAALETEELFMNRILGDIDYEISVADGVNTSLPNSGSNSTKATEETNNIFAQDKSGNKDEVKQSTYDKEVEKYLEQGYDMATAVEKADASLGVKTMTYSGSMKAIDKAAEKMLNIFEDIELEDEEKEKEEEAIA